jgi:hypothetical protein
MPFLNQTTAPRESAISPIPEHSQAKTHAQQVAEYTAAGWTILSDGHSGTQLQGPKKMKFLDAACMFGGVLLCVLGAPVIGAGAFVIGAIMVIIALIDYGLLTKRQQVYLARE